MSAFNKITDNTFYGYKTRPKMFELLFEHFNVSTLITERKKPYWNMYLVNKKTENKLNAYYLDHFPTRLKQICVCFAE